MSYIQTLRACISFSERLQNSELVGELNKLQLEGVELVEQNVSLREENLALKQEISTLNSKLAFGEKLTYLHGLYHCVGDDGTIGQPFCPTCWDAKQIGVHVHWEGAACTYICTNCKSMIPASHREHFHTPDEIHSEHGRSQS